MAERVLCLNGDSVGAYTRGLESGRERSINLGRHKCAVGVDTYLEQVTIGVQHVRRNRNIDARTNQLTRFWTCDYDRRYLIRRSRNIGGEFHIKRDIERVRSSRMDFSSQNVRADNELAQEGTHINRTICAGSSIGHGR